MLSNNDIETMCTMDYWGVIVFSTDLLHSSFHSVLLLGERDVCIQIRMIFELKETLWLFKFNLM